MIQMRQLATLPILLTLAVLAGLSQTGCAGYQVGPSRFYRPEFQTVHVPIFRSDTLRRNLGELLTEAVVKEIQDQTPYRVVPRERADTVLSGRVVSASKQVLTENPNDEPRDLDVDLYVEVRWLDNQGNVLMEQVALPIESAALSTAASSHFVPEGGQSYATAQLRNIRRAAKKIVSLMEYTPL